MPPTIIVLTTTGDTAEARRIAQSLVERKVAACVNIVPGIQSTYRWKGEVAQAEECLLVIKTTRALYLAVESVIRELHSYDLPEVLALDVSGGAETYLNWIGDSVLAPSNSET